MDKKHVPYKKIYVRCKSFYVRCKFINKAYDEYRKQHMNNESLQNKKGAAIMINDNCSPTNHYYDYPKDGLK